jgi:hypothetical protein
MKNSTFKNIPNAEKTERFLRIVRSKAFDALNRDEQNELLEKVDLSRQYSIRVTTNPLEFQRIVTLKDTMIENDGHIQSTVAEGTAVFGKFSFGKSFVKKNDAAMSGSICKRAMLDAGHPAAAVIKIRNSGYANLSISLQEDELIIYVPRDMAQMAG